MNKMNKMNKLIIILIIVTLTNCKGSEDSNNIKVENSSSKNNIVGDAFKIGDLEVAQFDFHERMNWEDALKACKTLGDGWKLPSKEEMDFIYQNKDAISGLNLTSTADPNYGGGYWTSTEYEYDPQGAWVQDFHNGGFGGVVKEAKYHVRAVRVLKRN